MKYLIALFMILAPSLTAAPADASGHWRGSVSTPKGDYPIEFSFTVDHGNVEGTMLGTDGTPFKIEQGRVEENKITFSVTLNYPGKSFVRTYKGILAGDEIHFTVDSSGQMSELVVKRVK